MIDVCPVGALTDRTFRFKNRVWFTKPVDAHRNCPKCCGKVPLWMRGDEVLRVTARKDQWGEVEEFICNECRFEKKKTTDWIIEGPTKVARHSVISAGHYEGVKKPHEALPEVMGGRKPKLVFDIHSVSDVNEPEVDLSLLPGPATSETFDGNPNAYGNNVNDLKLGKGSNSKGTDSTIIGKSTIGKLRNLIPDFSNFKISKSYEKMIQLLMIDWWYILEKFLLVGFVVTLSLLVAMYTTYAERKIAAFLQDRRGPNRAGPFGILQPLADGGKLFFKEEIIPLASSKFLFILGPC